MKTNYGLLMIAAACLSQTAASGETKIERRESCVCTSGQGGPPGTPPPGHAAWNMEVLPGDGNNDVNVHVIKGDQGEEQRIVIVRRSHRDGADTNKDGKVTRNEFIARAEKHFGELDKNNDGALSPEEAHPPMPPMPPTPPMPPMPPAPPAPPQH